VARGHSPLEDKVEPVPDHGHPDEPDAHRLAEVEPDREEDEESIPEVGSEGNEEEPVLGALEALLQPACRLDARVVQDVHAGLHPPAAAALGSSGCPALRCAAAVLYSAGSCLLRAGRSSQH